MTHCTILRYHSRIGWLAPSTRVPAAPHTARSEDRMSDLSFGPGIAVTGRITPEYAQILTPDASRSPPSCSARSAGAATNCWRGAPRARPSSTPASCPTSCPRRAAFATATGPARRCPADIAGSPRRDHRPGRPQDDHQCAQLGRERVHGRLRGRQHAALGQQHPGPHQPARRDPPPDRLRLARRQGVQAQRQDRGAVRAAARLAPAGEARARRRRSRSPAASSTSRCTSSTTRRSWSRAAAARTSTCRSSRAISRRGCGTTSS